MQARAAVLSRQEASKVALEHVTATAGTEGTVQGIRAPVAYWEYICHSDRVCEVDLVMVIHEHDLC